MTPSLPALISKGEDEAREKEIMTISCGWGAADLTNKKETEKSSKPRGRPVGTANKSQDCKPGREMAENTSKSRKKVG